MSDIYTVRPPERAPAPVEPIQAAAPVKPIEVKPDNRLEPAVTLDLSPQAESAADRKAPAETKYQSQFVRDNDSRQIVLQTVDPASGDIVVQLPSVTVLKARAYADATAARSAETAKAQAALNRIA